MKRMFRTMVLAFCGIIALGSSADAQGVKGTCRSDYMNATLVEWFQGIVAPTTAGDSSIRDTLGLVGVTPAQVNVVTDASICTKAAVALNKLAAVPQSTYSLNVVRVGTLYAVFEPTWRVGEWTSVNVFDSRWRFLQTYLAF